MDSDATAVEEMERTMIRDKIRLAIFSFYTSNFTNATVTISLYPIFNLQNPELLRDFGGFRVVLNKNLNKRFSNILLPPYAVT
ncbi:hypothetical protein SAMN05421804_10625 [Proteiniclasticum ruminis]|uniref:Uncharacterized protein n=1 Tax=Proteiniclasticum ruminis TaxID=398199 RepID=A0A1G8Q3J8_9CLOT|nr:hypothetical protein SAMN05421804_10625 [Proteiniclasticum ruminis]